jgi:hypothetical protein
LVFSPEGSVLLMTGIDFSTLRFAGYMVTPAPELRRSDRRVPRFVTAHRFYIEECVYSHEMTEPGRWDRFKLDRALRDLIPERQRLGALQAVSTLSTTTPSYGRPNVCLSLDAVREFLAAARIPRNSVQILEAGMPQAVADDVLGRENFFERMSSDKEGAHGIVLALRQNRFMSGGGTLLGVEPWYVDKRLRHSWREKNDIKAVRTRAFSRLNEHGLLCDLIDFELFVPGLTKRRVVNPSGKWIPLVLVRHTVESVIGDARPRTARSPI